jgi:hypothetical protein
MQNALCLETVMILSVGLKAFPFFKTRCDSKDFPPKINRSFVKLVSFPVRLIRIVYKEHIGHGNKNSWTECKKNNKREPDAKCVGTQYSQPTHICDIRLLLLLCKFTFRLRLH